MKRMHTIAGARAANQPPLPLQATINANHPLAQKLLRGEEKQLKLAQQAYSLALLTQDMLHGTALTTFIQGNIDTLLISVNGRSMV